MVVKRLKRYRDLPYEEKRKVVSLVFEEAKRMKENGKGINYSELSRMVLMKAGIVLHYNTIRQWLTGKRTPLRVGRPLKAIRRPPDNDGQVVRGLTLTDLHREDLPHTIFLTLRTTKDFFAISTQRLLSRYGWVNVSPVLNCSEPRWMTTASLAKEQWIHELEKPIHELTKIEKLKLLSGSISGDGWISAYIRQSRKSIEFVIGLVSTQKSKAQIYHRVLESLSIPHGLTKQKTRPSKSNIRTTAPYTYRVIIASKTAVKYLLTNLRLLQPFREVKRILALRFIEKDMLDRDLVKPIWEYLRVLEKYSTIRSRIRACELIPKEEFDKKHLDKQWMLKQLRRELYEYADMVRELKPTATRIISDLRPPFTSSFSFGLFRTHLGSGSCLTCSWSAGSACWPYA